MTYNTHNWVDVSDPNNPPEGAQALDAITLKEMDDGIKNSYTHADDVAKNIIKQIKNTPMVIQRNVSGEIVSSELEYEVDNPTVFSTNESYAYTSSTPIDYNVSGNTETRIHISRPNDYLTYGHGYTNEIAAQYLGKMSLSASFKLNMTYINMPKGLSYTMTLSDSSVYVKNSEGQEVLRAPISFSFNGQYVSAYLGYISGSSQFNIAIPFSNLSDGNYTLGFDCNVNIKSSGNIGTVSDSTVTVTTDVEIQNAKETYWHSVL